MSYSDSELFFTDHPRNIASISTSSSIVAINNSASDEDDSSNSVGENRGPEFSPHTQLAAGIQRSRYSAVQLDQLTRPLVSDRDNRGYYIPPSNSRERKRFRDEYILLGETVKDLYPHLTTLLTEAVGQAQALEAQGNKNWWECPWTWTGALRVVATSAGCVAAIGGIASAIPYWNFSDSGWVWFCVGLGLGKDALPWIRNIVRGASVGANLGLGAEWAQVVVKSTLEPPETDAKFKEILKKIPCTLWALMTREPIKVGLMMFALYCGVASGSFNYITAINPYNQARALVTGVLSHLQIRDAQEISGLDLLIADNSFVINGLINAYGAYRVLCWLGQRLRSGFEGVMERVVTTASKTTPIIDILSRDAFRAYLIETFSLPSTTSYKVACEALQRLSDGDRVRVVQAFGESFGKTRSPSCAVERGLAGTTLTVAAVGTVATGKYVWENSLKYLVDTDSTSPIADTLNFTISTSIASWLLFGCGLFVTVTAAFAASEKWERYLKKYTVFERAMIALCEIAILAIGLFSSFSNGGVGGQELFSEHNEPGDYSVGSWNSFVLSFSMAFFVNRVGIADWTYGLPRTFWNLAYSTIQTAQCCFGFAPETVERYYPYEPVDFVESTLSAYRAIYTLSEGIVFDRYPFEYIKNEWPTITAYNKLYVQFHGVNAVRDEPILEYRTMRSDQREEVIDYITAAQLGEPLPATEKELNDPHIRASILLITSQRGHTSLDEVYRARFADDRWTATVGVATKTDPNTDAELKLLTAEKERIDQHFYAAREGIAKREIADAAHVFGQQDPSQVAQHEERIEILRHSTQLLEMLSQKRQSEIIRLRQQRQKRMDIVAEHVISNQQHLAPRQTQQLPSAEDDLELGHAQSASCSFWSSCPGTSSSGYELIRESELPSIGHDGAGCFGSPGTPSGSDDDEEDHGVSPSLLRDESPKSSILGCFSRK